MVAAGDALNFPRGHCEQGAEPIVSLNFPASHAMQGFPSGPVYPTMQVQLLRAPLAGADNAFSGHVAHTEKPPVEYVSAAHVEQVASPWVPLNLPGSQAAHSPPLLPVYPALHLQSDSSLV